MSKVPVEEVDPDHIGYLINASSVCCRDCAWKVIHEKTGEHWCKLYRVNIGSYWQSCHQCGKILVEGQECGQVNCETSPHYHTHWCELYPKKTA